MNKYMKNKNFIPEKFYDRKELSENKREKGLIILFLILNLILIPMTTKSISKSEEKPIVYNNNNKSRKIDLGDINKWIESVIKDDIEGGYITKDNGEITVDSLDKIEELSSNNYIKINEVNLEGDGKYKLGVRLNE